MSSTLSTKETKKIQWCDRCRSAHEMPRCELIYLPRSEGGHIPDMLYESEDECGFKDVAFICFACDQRVIRNSEAHDNSKFDEQNEDNWYCPDCPTPIEEEEEDKYDHAPVINSDQLDTALCHDRFNWSFDKPTEEEGKYTTIYITHFDKDQ